MQPVRRAVAVVEDVIHTGLDTPGGCLEVAQVMGGGQSPGLVALAVAVVLILSLIHI